MQFSADADIYMDKKYESDCNVKQWDLYNSIADTYKQLYKYQSSLWVSNNILVRWYLNT